MSIEQDCLKCLKEYYWPGNIRQLENIVEHAVLMSEGNELRLADLPKGLSSLLVENDSIPHEEDAVTEFENGGNFKEIVKRQTHAVERELITKALEEDDGNISRTAEFLGLSRKGLQLKLKELNIKYVV